MTCTSACPTQDHPSWGACMRAKNLRVAYCRSAENRDYTTQKRGDRELKAYAETRKQGIQPDSTRMRDIERAQRLSDKWGMAYGIQGGE